MIEILSVHYSERLQNHLKRCTLYIGMRLLRVTQASSQKHEKEKKEDRPTFPLITTAVINFSVVVVSNYFLDRIPTVLLHRSWSSANKPLPNIVWNIYLRRRGSLWCKYI